MVSIKIHVIQQRNQQRSSLSVNYENKVFAGVQKKFIVFNLSLR